MTVFKAHFIHVGNMNNKGTQALFKSDFQVINGIIKNKMSISVSTIDIQGVKGLKLPLKAVLPPMVDIPYENADQLARRRGYGRGGLRYRFFVLAMLVNMFAQLLLSVFSIVFSKVGLKAFYRGQVLEYVKNCDLVISHSDESFKETASLLPLNLYWVITWWSMLIARTWEILVAKSYDKPVVLFPNSVGPFRTWIGRLLSRFSLGNCDYVLIRDPISFDIVNSLGIKSCKVLTFDTALLFNSPRENLLNDFSRPLMGVSPGVYSHSLSKEEVHSYTISHAKALDAAIEKYGFFVVFLPHYVSGFLYDDLAVCKSMLSEMRNKDQAKILNAGTVEEYKLLLDQMDMIISSKMHPAVLGASGYVPCLCIAYDHKQTGFFNRLGMDDCTLDIRWVSYERLLSKIDQVWNQKERLVTMLKNQMPEWKKHVKETIGKTIAPFVGRN